MKPSRAILFSAIAVCLDAGFAACLIAGEPEVLPPANPAAAADAAPASRLRAFGERELLPVLTAALQDEYVKDKGELELRLSLAWPARNVPDEPLTVRILDLPPKGIASTFIARFELRTARESLGTWQLPLQARVWREVWVSRSALRRGDALADADIAREKRDLLVIREPLAEFAPNDNTLELAESVQAGAPLLARSVKLRPVIHRGQTADAVLQDGGLSISLKVQVLEDGVPGQIIRARNLQSRRDIIGKVIDEKTILLAL